MRRTKSRQNGKHLLHWQLAGFGAIIETSREGSRVGVVLFGEVRVLHQPHPDPSMDKGAVAAVRDWLQQHGVTP